MEYQCISARFNFWNGKTEYTVEYNYGLQEWFIFNNNDCSNCIYRTKTNSIKYINESSSRIILYSFLDFNT